MTCQLRSTLAKRLYQQCQLYGLKKEPHLPWCIRVPPTVSAESSGRNELYVDQSMLVKAGCLPPMKQKDRTKWIHDTAEMFSCDEVFRSVSVTEKIGRLNFSVDNNYFTKNVLTDVMAQKSKYGIESAIHRYRHSKEHGLQEVKQAQTVLVEYSSPNIAKPFHAGHLRSTIIGNVIANVYEALGHTVHRLNYLGDWGTQFGLLGVAFKQYGSEEELKKNPLKHLVELYVKINLEAASGDEAKAKRIREEALQYFNAMEKGRRIQYFNAMEKGESDAMDFWKRSRDLSIEECTSMYKRLGVCFDVYEGEAMYHERARELVHSMGESGLLETDSKTGIGYVDLTQQNNGQAMRASFVKSDGSTLYITRDVVACIARKIKYNFDKIHYVVENGQHDHFKHLVAILQRLGHTWIGGREDVHVKFGLVEGMSTRAGTVVLLGDVLDEARDRMVAKIRNTATSKLSGAADIAEVSERLAVSAIVVQDLRHARNTRYEFNWKKMLQFEGNTGVFLQYTHARLCSLEAKCELKPTVDCDFSLLSEKSARDLVQSIARYDQILHATQCDFEPSYIVTYLFKHCHLIGKALQELKVVGQPEDIAQARLLLFHSSRLVLVNALSLLGIEPVDRM